MEIDQSTIGGRIKAVRMHHALTQKAMAEAIGIQTAYLSGLERGIYDSLPKLLIKRLCDNYGVNDEWLRNGEGAMLWSPAKVIEEAQPSEEDSNIRLPQEDSTGSNEVLMYLRSSRELAGFCPAPELRLKYADQVIEFSRGEVVVTEADGAVRPPEAGITGNYIDFISA